MKALALIVTILIALLIAYIFNITELISIKLNSDLGVFAVVIFLTATIVFGLVISFSFGEIYMKPTRTIINGMTELSDGKYDIEIDLGNNSVLKELAECFNTLAKELKKNEITVSKLDVRLDNLLLSLNENYNFLIEIEGDLSNLNVDDFLDVEVEKYKYKVRY